MSLPDIIISFRTTGVTAIGRGNRGYVALIIKDNAVSGYHKYDSIADVPTALKADNKAYVERAFTGGQSVPKSVAVYSLPEDATDYTEALNYLATAKFDYLACPPDASEELCQTVASWVKAQRDNSDKKVKAVLPETAGDHEGIINFATNDIKVGDTTYTAAQYCSRIAGLLAGTPLTVASTFTELPEVTDVPRMTKAEAGAMIDAGKFILYHDGEKVKVARGVNSLVTTTLDKGEAFSKIKIVDIIDMIHDDICKTANDSYIGKIANSYDNKCLLITAIQGYFDQLETDGLLDRGRSAVGIDIENQLNYLKSTGVNVDELDEQGIKSANTGSKVFLTSEIKPLDAIEEITLRVTI